MSDEKNSVDQAIDMLGRLVAIIRECGCPEDEDPGLWVRRLAEPQRYATQLPGNKTPDVSHAALPQDHAARVQEFLSRLAQVRGKFGRWQIREVELAGWKTFGEDLDRLDCMGQPTIRIEGTPE